MSAIEHSGTTPIPSPNDSSHNGDDSGALEMQRNQKALATVPEHREEDTRSTAALPYQTENFGVEVFDEREANGPLQILRGGGGLSLHGEEFHVGGEVNVTHARNELHQYAHVTCETYARKLVEKHVTFNTTDNAAGYEQIKDQSRNEITLDEQLFVQTSSFNTAMDHLQQKGLLLIQGPPGSGKSALGHALLRHYEGQEYTPLVLHRCEEWRTHVGGDRKQVVLLDGVLGEVCLDQASFTEWSKVFACLLRYAKAMKCLVVFVMYKHVFKELEARGEVGSFFQHVPVLDLQRGTTFTDTEKKEMIRKHMEGINMPPSVEEEILLADQSGSLFPGCVKRFKQAAAYQDIEDATFVFSSPSEPLASFLWRSLSDRAHGTCVAAMLLLTLMKQGDCFAAVEKVEAQLKFLGFDKSIARKVQSLAKSYRGTYIAWNKSAFCSRPVHESACRALARTEYLSIMIKVCDLEFLLTHVSAFDDGDISTVNIGGDALAMRPLYQRILQELAGGNVPEICQHPCLQKGDFLAGFKRFCVLENCLDKVLAATDPKYNDSLLYWASVCGSHALTEWCATLLLEKNTDPKGLVVTCQRILFLYALMDERRSSQCVKTMTFAMEKCGARPELMSSVTLPLPELSKRYTRDMKGRCDALITKTLSNVVCYLGDASLAFPTSVISLQKMQHRPVILVKFPGKHWSMALRILSDRNIDEQDEDGNTFLHLAAGRGDVLDIEIAVRSGTSLGIQNNKDQTPPQVAKTRRSQSSSFRYSGIMASDKITSDSNHPKSVTKACQEGDLERLKVLLCYSLGVNDSDKEKSPLMICCQYGQTEACRLLINNGANINPKVVKSFPLMVSCKEGFQEIVELLIDHGAQVNKVGQEGTTPLHEACKNNFNSIVTCLLQNGADAEVMDKHKITPLSVASKNGHTAVAQILLDMGAQAQKEDQERTALHVACENNRVKVVRLLLEYGVNPEGSEAQKESPLHLACQRSNSDIVSVLIAKGADVNTVDKRNETPLHFACSNSNAENVDTLITKGADINVANSSKQTPLHFACMFGLPHIVALLIKHGVKMDCEDYCKQTPLYLACENGHESVATQLIFHGAPVSCVTDRKQTLLHPASRAGVTSTVQLLLRQGVDVHARDSGGKNSLHIASANGHLEIVEQLLDAGLDVSAKDKGRRTALHYASAAGHLQIAEVLIQQGTEVNCRDDCLQTPLFYAAKYGNADIATLFLRHGVEISAPDWKQNSTLQTLKKAPTLAWEEPSLGVWDMFDDRDIDFSKSPLHAACQRGHIKIAEQLVQHQADVNALDKNKQTPLHYANRWTNKQLVEFLLEHGANPKARDKDTRTPAQVSRIGLFEDTCKDKAMKALLVVFLLAVLLVVLIAIFMNVEMSTKQVNASDVKPSC